jgi:hypothetical protein
MTTSNTFPRTCIVGDVHGQLAKLTALLRSARLLSDDLHWAGGDTSLWFMGDFFDRGPHGLAVVDLVMRLQQEAPAAGGRVQSILGNHDFLLLSVDRFGRRGDEWAAYFTFQWRQNGGRESDRIGLLSSHIDWLSQLPAMAHVHNLLLAHADSSLYLHYGSSVETVNAAFARIMASDDPRAWDLLLTRFSEHNGFADARPGGHAAARKFLDRYIGTRLIHGHSPIHEVIRVKPNSVVAPHIYSHDRCINVDGGMFAGGPGFVFEVPPDWM